MAETRLTVSSRSIESISAAFQVIADTHGKRAQMQEVLRMDMNQQESKDRKSIAFGVLMPDLPKALPLDEQMACAQLRVGKMTEIIARNATLLRERFGIDYEDEDGPSGR